MNKGYAARKRTPYSISGGPMKSRLQLANVTHCSSHQAVIPRSPQKALARLPNLWERMSHMSYQEHKFEIRCRRYFGVQSFSRRLIDLDPLRCQVLKVYKDRLTTANHNESSVPRGATKISLSLQNTYSDFLEQSNKRKRLGQKREWDGQIMLQGTASSEQKVSRGDKGHAIIHCEGHKKGTKSSLLKYQDNELALQT